MSQLKILVLHQNFLGKDEPGGSRFNQFAKHWEELGHEITVVAGTVNQKTGIKKEEYRGKLVYKEVYSKNVNVLRTYVPESYSKNFIGRFWGYFAFTLSSFWAILVHSKKHDIMIVTSPPLFVGITGILTKYFKRTPLVFEVRDLWPESAIDTGVVTNKLIIEIAYFVERLSYKTADRINVLTPAFKKKLMKKKGISEEKICYIPNGADLDIFQPGLKDNWVREKYNLKDKFVLTYIGAHGVANHLDYLLDVAKEFSADDNVIIVLIGDGMQKAGLKKRAESENINNILFIESQPKQSIPDFCNASDVCTAILKKIDTFKTVYPNKVFDYMSCAKPILLGIDGVARDLVEKSNSGYYVDPEDAKGFADKIRELQQDENLRTELGNNGYKFVQEHFSREALAIKYINELEKVVKR